MDDERRVESILAEWQEQLDRGHAPDPETVISAHPELADRLRACFAVLLCLKIGDAQAPTPPLRALAPDRYSVFRRVAEGGMGLVYWAIDNDLNREVAFKVIRTAGASPGATPDSPGEITPPAPDTPASRAFETLKQRFLQEAWVTGGMAHPGIVPVYELGQTAAGVPYYTMRFVRGEQTLEDALAGVDGAAPEERLQLLEPFLKVCDTIQYAHAQGVVHRDLKPENIALGQFGEVVVLDWGLAKLQGRPDDTPDPWRERLRAWREDADVKTLSTALGTPGYMAPEALAGKVHAIDEQSDVYSLGAILFRVLTGRAVFAGARLGDLARQVLHTDAPEASDVAPSVPEPLSRICRAALARTKADRPAGVAALAEGIRQWQVQSRLDREVEGWLREAESGLREADGLGGHARVAALDRVLLACGRVLDGRPEQEQALALRQRADARRADALEEGHRAARRRLLTRAAAVLLVIGTVVAALVAGELERRRQAAVVAQEAAETNLHRARIRGLVAASAEAEPSDPMLALLLARSAVRQSGAPSASAVSRLYAALVNSRERARFDGHEAEVRSADFAPAGDAILTSSRDRTARIWPLAGGEPLLLVHEEALRDAVFSPTGSHVLTRSERGHRAYLWTRAGKLVARLEGHAGVLRSAAFAPKGDRILTASLDGTARLWDLAGTERMRLRHEAAVHSAVFSAAGDRILTTAGTHVRLWDLAGRELQELEGPALAWEAAFSPSGGEILASFGDDTTHLWSLDGEELATYRGIRARMSAEGDRVVTTLPWHQLLFHDREGQLLATFHPPGGATAGFEFLPGEHRIVVACYDSSVRIWDPAGVRATASLTGHTGWTEDIAFSPRGDRILTAARDGTVRMWESAGNAYAALRGHRGRIDSAKYSPTGEYILTAARDGKARLFTAQGRKVASVPYASWSRTGFSPSGDRFVVCADDQAAHVWDLAGKELAVLRGHEAPLVGAAFTSDGREILTTSRDNSIRRWGLDGRALGVVPQTPYRPKAPRPSPRGGRFVVPWVPPRKIEYVTGLGATLYDQAGRPLAEMGSKVRVAAYAPGGGRIVTGSYDGTVGIYDAKGRELVSFRGHARSVLCCAFSPDGASVLTGSDDRTARLWDLEGTSRAVLRGHSSPVLRLAFDPEGRRILTGADDQTARLWDIAGKHLATLHHAGNLSAVGFAPDGATFLTASYDGAARIWPVGVKALLAIADARITRDLTAEERTRYVELLGE